MRRLLRPWLLFAMATLSYRPDVAAQSFRLDPALLDGSGGGYLTKWDSVQDRLILHRDVSDSSEPAAWVLAMDGSRTAIYPLRDLSGSKYVDVWGAAATPDGGIVLATIVGYAPRGVKPAQLKSFLLTYDGAGNLKKVWDMEPYHHHFVAVDGDGNVFALGDSGLQEPYFLIVKYSSTGQVVREFLSSNLFPEGDRVIDYGSPNGNPQMFISGNVLLVWLSRPQEVFRFSLSGQQLSRTSLAPTLRDLVAEGGFHRVTVRALATGAGGDLIADVQFWPSHPNEAVQSKLVRVPVTGSAATVLPTPAEPAILLGATARGRLVYLQPEPQSKASLVTIW